MKLIYIYSHFSANKIFKINFRPWLNYFNNISIFTIYILLEARTQEKYGQQSPDTLGFSDHFQNSEPHLYLSIYFHLYLIFHLREDEIARPKLRIVENCI